MRQIRSISTILNRFLLLCSGVCMLIFASTCSSTKDLSKEESVKQPEIQQKSVLERLVTQRADTVAVEIHPDPIRPVVGPVNVDSLLSRMTVREKIGQLFLTFSSGFFINEESPVYQELAEKITRYHVGGLIFNSGTVYGQAMLTNKLQELSRLPLWITQDMEYGAAMRVRRATRLPPAMGIAATGNPDYSYWAGKITAHEARALGVNQIFAPVLDVNNNPDNPVINVRAFSGDPQIVSRFGNAFITGVESEGVVATAKHFPGHGDTDIDSHLSLPVIQYNYERLDTLELIPFRSAIKNGVSSIMSAHISFPEISNNPGKPGTLDESILNTILIDSLQFNGMVVTDGLEMKGITDHFSPGEVVLEALHAGADLMLLSPDELTAITEVEMALEKGEISEERIDRSVRKLLQWKKDHGLFTERKIDLTALSGEISKRQHSIIADEIARKSVTLVKNENDILPIQAKRFPRILVVSIADDESGRTGSYFGDKVKDYHPDVKFRVFDKRSSNEEKNEIMDEARDADLIILGSFIYVRSSQPIQLSGSQLDFVKQLTRLNKPSVLVAFGNPYVIKDLPDTEVHLLAWSSNSDQVRNTVPALFGASEISGKVPIRIPGMYQIGDGIELPQSSIRFDQPETVGLSYNELRKVDDIMNRAIFDSTFPGGIVAVLKDGVVAYRKGYGYHTYEKHEKVEDTDVYDLASLTKIVATTAAVMKLVDEKKLKLDDPVAKYIPEFLDKEKRKVTIRHLLTHESGLPPFRVYVDSLKQRDQILKAVRDEPLVTRPGTQYIYSDLGFILLGEIIENVSGTSLNQFLRKEFYYPMGMSSTFFRPHRIGRWMRQRIPPTEIDTVFRMDTVQAEVHDERSYYLDGIAGHAGLFSSARDLAIYAQMLLNNGSYGGERFISEKTVQRFTQYRSKHGNRGLGFDHKSEGFSTAGTLMSPDTYGHTGFTGTSLWIDPQRDLAVIILTNRTYPHRSYGSNISKVRAAVADAVISSTLSR